MRRLLVVTIAAALPALAAAQVPVDPGVLAGLNNNFIGAAQCSGTGKLTVRWTMKPMPNNMVGGTGAVRIYASNKKRTPTTDDPRTCYKSTDTTNDSTIKMSFVTQFDDQQLATGQKDIPPADVAKMMSDVGINCTVETTATPVYMCALAYSDVNSNAHIGYANGDFNLNNRKPNPPQNVGVDPAEEALKVRWTEDTSGENSTEFRVTAVNTTPPNDVHTARTNASPVFVKGLTNGVLYDVTVVGVSAAGTESDPAPSPPAQGRPQPTEDFWDWYHNQHNGVEQGGCATGAAGALAMLGAAALLRVRRRKP